MPNQHTYGSADMSTAERFWSKVEFTDTCWLWTAQLSKGYGQFWHNGMMVKAHRFAYEFCGTLIGAEREIDHLCRTKRRVRPDHLEAVTHHENLTRGNSPPAIHGRKTHCKRGHEFTEQNTTVRPTGRECRRCRVEIHYERAKGRDV